MKKTTDIGELMDSIFLWIVFPSTGLLLVLFGSLFFIDSSLFKDIDDGFKLLSLVAGSIMLFFSGKDWIKKGIIRRKKKAIYWEDGTSYDSWALPFLFANKTKLEDFKKKEKLYEFYELSEKIQPTIMIKYARNIVAKDLEPFKDDGSNSFFCHLFSIDGRLRV